MTNLHQAFKSLKDPRIHRKRQHKLPLSQLDIQSKYLQIMHHKKPVQLRGLFFDAFAETE